MKGTMKIAPRHPMNTSFDWQPAGGRRIVSDAQARQWDECGYFLLEGAIPADTIQAVAAEIDPLEERTNDQLRRETTTTGPTINEADKITFTTHIVTSSEVVRAFAQSEPFASLCADLVGPRVRLYWDQAVYKKPEPHREFPWHQDNGYTFIEPQQYLTCWVPLVDATVENGCPWVLPGLHLMGTLKHWSTPVGFQCAEVGPDDAGAAVPVEAKAGDVVVFSSLTPHRTGPNLSTGVRKAYILQYAPDGANVPVVDGTAMAGRQEHPDRQFLIPL
jgi:ectoine hydroxylase-related dioxygenase (phytanoyl-CoA dioxygenase family)